jgi:hypothetical protein
MPEASVKDNPFLAPLGGKDEWERFLAQVRESKLTLGIWLMSADVAGIEDGRLILSFSTQNRFALEMIRDPKNKRLIENYLEKFYGRKFTVEACETVAVESGVRPDRQAELEIKARTGQGKGAGTAGGPPEAPAEDPATGTAAPSEAKDAKKQARGAKKGARAAKVNNPSLGRIMDRLDAELLD